VALCYTILGIWPFLKSILHKQGELTVDEWVCIHLHPFYAYEILEPIVFLRQALDIPIAIMRSGTAQATARLEGLHIPLAARIFAVVDVWDALTSDRPYRQAWSKEKAREHIQTEAGTHFDPQVVKTFFLESK